MVDFNLAVKHLSVKSNFWKDIYDFTAGIFFPTSPTKNEEGTKTCLHSNIYQKKQQPLIEI